MNENGSGLSRNGLRTWQTLSAAALVVAAGAIGWDFTQLNAIRETIARISAGPSGETLEAVDTKIIAELSELRANQVQVMHRLDRIEDIMRDGSRHGP